MDEGCGFMFKLREESLLGSLIILAFHCHRGGTHQATGPVVHKVKKGVAMLCWLNSCGVI